MAYPESSDVAAGQPTASAHYNNLRKDSVYLGKTATTAAPMGTLLSEFVQNLRLEYLATNRIRCPYDAVNPARIVVNGYMLKQSANIDSGIGLFAGGAATFYIFAQQNIGTSEFGISASTSATPAANQRLIGECLWDGSNVIVSSVKSYYQPQLPPADYDSGWFAVTLDTLYTKYHNFGTHPRLYMLFHCVNADGSGQQNLVGNVGPAAATRSPIGATTTQFLIKTGNDASTGTLYSLQGNSGAGYYRILAWR